MSCTVDDEMFSVFRFLHYSGIDFHFISEGFCFLKVLFLHNNYVTDLLPINLISSKMLLQVFPVNSNYFSQPFLPTVSTFLRYLATIKFKIRQKNIS